MFCKYCGKKLVTENQKFCSSCGANLEESTQPNQQASSNINQQTSNQNNHTYQGNQQNQSNQQNQNNQTYGQNYEQKATNPEHNESKLGIGVLFALVLGLIGLVIGLVSWPEGTVARKTFLKGWTITFICATATAFLFSFIPAFVIGLAGINITLFPLMFI